MRRAFAGRTLALAAACLALGGAEPPAQTRVFTPYVELDQIATRDFGGDDDVLTYTQVVAGVDAAVQTRRVSVQLSYQYQHQFAEAHGVDGGSTHDGLVQAHAEVAPGLTLEAGGIATRVRTDIRERPAELDGINHRDTQQAYAAYAGPSFARQFGDVAVAASYRLAYVRIDDGDVLTLPGGQTPVDSYGSSWNQVAAASVGMRPGTLLPFGWTVSGAWTRETTRNLSGRDSDRFARLDLVQPVSPTLAVTGGVGYQDTHASTLVPLIGADGLPVLDSHGRYRADPHRPRLTAYDVSGLIYDGGLTWRPSPRTQVEVHVGHQYGDTFYAGDARWQFARDVGLQVVVFDGVTTFGRELTADLAALPGSFQVHRTGLDNGFGGGCVFGQRPGTGGCLNDALQSASTGNFHNRGGYALISGSHGSWAFGVSASYVRRNYLGADDGLPDVLTLDKITDQSVDLQADLQRHLSPRATLELDAFGGWYKTGLAGFDTTRTIGADGNLFYNFTNHLVGTVAAGVEWTDGSGFDSETSASLLGGIRYQF